MAKIKYDLSPKAQAEIDKMQADLKKQQEKINRKIEIENKKAEKTRFKRIKKMGEVLANHTNIVDFDDDKAFAILTDVFSGTEKRTV